ncbi:MAG: YgfZ/GcvT domain-containing protein [Solirubrobacterales bacterium]
MEGATSIELDGQYRAVREGAGVLERRGRRILAIGGGEAGEYLQGQLTNDLDAAGAGEGCYSALLDRKGHMQGDMRVLRTDDGFLIDTEAVAGDAVLRHLSTYKIGRDVTIEDLSSQRTILSVLGPAASEIALDGPLGPEHAHREVELDGVACLAVATDAGIDLFAAAPDAASIREALVVAGAEPVSEEAAEILRIESGRPRFGREMTTATIPQEAGITERAVSFTKGCYIGQETVARLHYRGKPNRRLRGLRLSAPAAGGEAITLGERQLGQIGTAVLSPARGPIALAIVRREAEPGASVLVGDRIEAEVVELPF